VTAVEASSASREELDARARKMAGGAVAVPVAVATPPAKVEAPQQADEADAETVAQRLRDWAAAWMAKDVDQYFTFYAKDFAPARSTSAKWINERRRLVSKPGPIEVKVGEVKAVPKGDTVVTSFTQNYTSNNYKDVSMKVLTWKMVNKQWVIVKESNR
jgi:adhesin transport system outer membrane protein